MLVVLLTVLQCGKGEDYLVAVAYTGKDSYIRCTAGETGGLVEIQYPHFAYSKAIPLGPFYGSSHGVSDKMKIRREVENTAVVVSASDEDVNIVVYADGVFSPLPISALGTKYIVPSSLAPNSSYRSLLLIATHSMRTSVDISFRMKTGSINFANYRYEGGDILSLKLDPYQTFMMSTPHDLNGTVINSEHSVAVYSGIAYARNYTVYDQLLPAKHHGQEYVVAVDDTKLELQIISEHSHVHITFSTGATVSTCERRLYNRSLEQGESLHFTTTRPVLVTLSRADGYSSVFTTVPPVHSYVTQKGVWLRGDNTTLKILTVKTARVLIINKQLNDVLTWTDVPGSRYKVGTAASTQTKQLYTSISSDRPFTVLSFSNGSVHNIGYNLSAESEVTVPYTGQSYLVAFNPYVFSFIRATASCLPPSGNIYSNTTLYLSVLVIATHIRKAYVDIIFRMKGNVTYDGRTYSDGGTLSVRLDKYQTLSINSSLDMTRTIVNATETIAVYSGTYEMNYMSNAFEQLLPVKHYGSEYIIAIQNTLRYQLQVVTDHNDTSITFNNGFVVSMGKDALYRKEYRRIETVHFNTTRPVMATLCTVGALYRSVIDGLVVVPPVSLYSKQTTLPARGIRKILTDEGNNVHVQETNDTHSTVFSPPVRWTKVSGSRYKVGTLLSGQYITTICSNSSFAVLAYDDYDIYNGGYTFRTSLDTGDSPNNAAVIVGISGGVVIVALLIASMSYVFYMRNKAMPVKEDAKQGDDIPSPPNIIYNVPDYSVADSGPSDDTYEELT